MKLDLLIIKFFFFRLPQALLIECFPLLSRIIFLSSVNICIANAFLTSSSPQVVTPLPQIVKGGQVVINLKSEPQSLHPISYSDYFGEHLIFAYLFDFLLKRNTNTYLWQARLAEKWEISKDGKIFTFKLRENAVFHDGKPIKAEDVKFSFEAIFNDNYVNSLDKRPLFESIVKVEVLDPLTVRFIAKDTYFKNFDVVASELPIIPKHIYSEPENVKTMHRKAIGSGPYKLEKFEPGQKILIKKFEAWYGSLLPDWSKAYNFDSIVFKFIGDENLAFEMLKKGELDIDFSFSPEVFVKKTEENFLGSKLIKVQAENSSPKSYGFIGWNLHKDLFKDKNVRIALAHLLNREEINQKYRYGMSLLATGPQYIQSEYASSNVKPLLYDPNKAKELLKKAGWIDSEKKGLLHKKIAGKLVEFKFQFLYSSKETEKYWTLYQEDLKKVGIIMEIKYLPWASFMKQIDERSFDAAALAWSNNVDWDPKLTWHSSSASSGGSNFISYKNTEVDRMIDQARLEVNRTKRIQMLRKVYELIAAEAPYVWLFNNKYELYVHSSDVKKVSDSNKYDIGFEFWWKDTNFSTKAASY